jgi:DNA polymerase V
MGIPMGVPYFQIKDILKKQGVTTFSSHLALYRDISRRVFTVMKNELGMIDQYSVDEAFFTTTVQPEALAKEVRQVIERQVGIPVSIGIAHTKTQAKYANTIAKKTGGVCCLDTEDWLNLAPGIVLSSIWGVGGSLELNFKAHGLRTVAELLAADSARIARLFGQNGLRLQSELRGVQAIPIVQQTAPQQSIMSSRSFKNTTVDYATIADAVAYHVRHAAADLRKNQQTSQAIRISINPGRHSDFFMRGGSKAASLVAPTSDSIELLKIANELLKDLFEPGVPYKKAGVTLTVLQSDQVVQSQLFDEVTPKDNKSLMAVIDTLNGTSGKELILLGSQLRTAGWQSRVNARSPRYTTRWSDIATVKAK